MGRFDSVFYSLEGHGSRERRFSRVGVRISSPGRNSLLDRLVGRGKIFERFGLVRVGLLPQPLLPGLWVDLLPPKGQVQKRGLVFGAYDLGSTGIHSRHPALR